MFQGRSLWRSPRCLIALALTTGRIGRKGTGLHTRRSQNNVQGASDAGLIPMVCPDYQAVEKAAVREMFEAFRGRTLDPKNGLTVVEIMRAIHAGKIRGMYVESENPAMLDPVGLNPRVQALHGAGLPGCRGGGRRAGGYTSAS